MQLNEGPLFFCSFTDIAANAKKPNDMDFPSQGGTLHGAGLFAALSYDEGKTWPYKRLVTPGGPEKGAGDRHFFLPKKPCHSHIPLQILQIRSLPPTPSWRFCVRSARGLLPYAGTRSILIFLPSACAARVKVASVTDVFSGSSSRSSAAREVRICFAIETFGTSFSRMRSTILRAIARLIAAASISSRIPSSRRKSSRVLPSCGFLAGVKRAPVLSHDWSQKRPGLRSASSMSLPVVILVPTISASLGVGDSSEPPMLKAKSLFVPFMQLARA